MRVVAALGDQNSQDLLDDPQHQSAVTQAIRTIEVCVEAARRHLSELGCAHIDDAIARLERTPRSPLSWSELNTRARALRDSIETELRQYLYYQYSRAKGDKLRAWETEWSIVLAAFPDLRTEAFSATDCYALQHNTASVFHSMRIAEHGLRALAKERRIRLPRKKPLEWANWQEIIRAIDDQIKTIGLKKAGAAKDAALEFYSGARADLNGFKDEYRNQVMHVRSAYDEHQALRALTNVRAFMVRVATKIDHSHQRIKWGFR